MAMWSKAWFCGRSLVGIVGSNPAWGAWMSVSCECHVLSGSSVGIVTLYGLDSPGIESC